MVRRIVIDFPIEEKLDTFKDVIDFDNEVHNGDIVQVFLDQKITIYIRNKRTITRK